MTAYSARTLKLIKELEAKGRTVRVIIINEKEKILSYKINKNIIRGHNDKNHEIKTA